MKQRVLSTSTKVKIAFTLLDLLSEKCLKGIPLNSFSLFVLFCFNLGVSIYSLVIVAKTAGWVEIEEGVIGRKSQYTECLPQITYLF